MLRFLMKKKDKNQHKAKNPLFQKNLIQIKLVIYSDKIYLIKYFLNGGYSRKDRNNKQ